MKKFGSTLVLRLLAVCAAVALVSCRPPPDEEGLSPAARKFLHDRWHPWFSVTTVYFQVHGPSQKDAESVAAELNFAVDRVSNLLGIEPAQLRGGGHFFLLARPTLWRDAVELNGLRPDRSAARVGREIYVFSERNKPWQEDAVAHEVVHWAIFQVFGPDAPLWLEEGLASALGQYLAGERMKESGRTLVVSRPAVSADTLLPWEQIFSYSDYPVDGGEMNAFLRQSQALVEVLWKNNPQELSRVVKGSMAEGVPPTPELLSGGKESQWKQLLMLAEKDAVAAWPF